MGKIPIFILIAALLVPCLESRSLLSLDLSGIQDVNNQKSLQDISLGYYFGHMATGKFKLKMSPKALEALDILQNVTKTGVSYHGVTDLPNFPSVSEKAFKALSSNLSEASLLLLRVMMMKNQKIPVVLQPTDEEFAETIKLLSSLRQYFMLVDEVGQLEVEKFDPLALPDDVDEILSNRIGEDQLKPKRQHRQYVIPEIPFQVSQDNLRHLLSDVFIKPRNHETEEGLEEKSVIRVFLTKTFEELGLLVYNHEFSSFGDPTYLKNPNLTGTNVIGILPGNRWGTAQDSLIIIGAHYDTVQNTTGTIDNASGTSAVIEAARMLTASDCTFENTIIFVAFDLEEIGAHGAFMFVKDFLLKLLLPTYGLHSIGGALILDCIANWDPNIGTQDVAPAWANKISGLKEDLERSNKTGDFLAVMYRSIPDNILANRLYQYFQGLGDPKYHLKMMGLNDLEETRPIGGTKLENIDFFRSDHFRFWYPSEVTPNISFPALLLTDTGPYRGKMAACYHASCDTVEVVQPDLGFLSKITQAIVWVAADLALGNCGPKGVFSIPEMFQVVKERRFIEQGPKEGMRPVVSIGGILEILKYLGRVNSDMVDASTDDHNQNNASESILLKTPLHRFRVPSEVNTITTSPFTKLTISIHGANSSYLIPLRVSSQSSLETPQTNDTLTNNTQFQLKNLSSSNIETPLQENITSSIQL